VRLAVLLLVVLMPVSLGMLWGNARADAPLRTAAIQADLGASYAPGAVGEVPIALHFDDVAALPVSGVVFLNVVEDDPARDWPQAAHRIFASASEDPPVFRQVLSAEALRAGLTTTVRFRLRANAPPGRYHLVIQVYRGPVTDPGRVRAEDRVFMRGFAFDIALP
jgi:hypothetical protein